MSSGVVLVAEDSQVVRALVRARLTELGYEVVEAADGVQANEAARATAPDAILLDVEMPQRDGFAVIADLKADPGLAAIPVVFITGRTTADDVVRGLELGAYDYLRKPFEPAELAARVAAAVRSKRMQDQLRSLNSELVRLATTDALTGLHNRRHLDDQLDRASAAAARHRRPLSVLLVDADHFKALNDEHGHAAGDAALIELAARLSSRVRASDTLGRWGGEEFMVIAEETDEPGAAVLAEALRAAAESAPIPLDDGRPVTLTVSVGHATYCGAGEARAIVRRADQALYAAKAAGRNLVSGAPRAVPGQSSDR